MSGEEDVPASVPTWRVNLAVRSSDLDPVSRLILMVLSDIADNDTAEIPPQRNPSTPQLARETGYCKRTVERRREALEEAGWIVLERPSAAERARHDRIKYRLAIPPGAEAPAATIRGDSQSPRKSDPKQSEATPSRPETPIRGDSQSPREATPSRLLEDVPDEQELLKPPAAADDRAERLRTADELTDKLWALHGPDSAEPRIAQSVNAIRSVIRIAIVDNRVPRNPVASALKMIMDEGRSISGGNLQNALGRLRPRLPTDPPAPPPKPPRRFCEVPAHSAVELTASGICPNCAADARAARDEFDEPPPAPAPIPGPRHYGSGHAMHLTPDPESRTA